MLYSGGPGGAKLPRKCRKTRTKISTSKTMTTIAEIECLVDDRALHPSFTCGGARRGVLQSRT